jgi:heme-degrading monooxygenase HmoA
VRNGEVEESLMITRVWRGRTSVEKADGYGAFLRTKGYPDYGGVDGNRGWVLLRRPADDAVEFMFVSFWESMESLSRYTGGEPERPKYYAEDRAALLELPDTVEHYEIVDAQIDLRVPD